MYLHFQVHKHLMKILMCAFINDSKAVPYFQLFFCSGCGVRNDNEA